MRGITTKADMQEYCERDSGVVIGHYGGKSTKAHRLECCLRTGSRAPLSADANRRNGTGGYRAGDGGTMRFWSPPGPNGVTAHASRNPPMIEQFKMLRPTAAARPEVE
ncbi:hypothetical protein [Methylobacterium sp. J-067]|uniref:hypothetical protein n=1 Tax=Methylobacterium sp. J-067 TaxID=2836648 RepID=UPI001FBBBF87|nr:hypothetical protein [Methylobacterium sp. J-067]MCJ2023986.1 hypothetical protein [Methylobacterium sp. J-067]